MDSENRSYGDFEEAEEMEQGRDATPRWAQGEDAEEVVVVMKSWRTAEEPSTEPQKVIRANHSKALVLQRQQSSGIKPQPHAPVPDKKSKAKEELPLSLSFSAEAESEESEQDSTAFYTQLGNIDFSETSDAVEETPAAESGEETATALPEALPEAEEAEAIPEEELATEEDALSEEETSEDELANAEDDVEVEIHSFLPRTVPTPAPLFAPADEEAKNADDWEEDNWDEISAEERAEAERLAKAAREEEELAFFLQQVAEKNEWMNGEDYDVRITVPHGNQLWSVQEAPVEQNKKWFPFKIDRKKVIREVLSWAAILLGAFFVAVLFSTYVLRPSSVSGTSMVPTLEDKQTVYISQLPYLFGEPEVGDIVVIDVNFEEPRTFWHSISESLKYNLLTKPFISEPPDTYWIKRVVGVAGDKLEFKDGKFYRNGEAVNEPYLKEQDVHNYPEGLAEPIVIQEGYVFLMGDNRNGSYDSRKIGQVSTEYIVGKLVYEKD